MYNILVGGAAGDGIDTVVAVFEKAVKRAGCHIFTTRDFMSRVRGGHNFTQVRFGPETITCHRDRLDGIVAFNAETAELHRDRLANDGFILCDASLDISDRRALKIDMRGLAKNTGNLKTAGSVAIGAALKLFGEKPETVAEIMRSTLKEDILEANLQALAAGFAAVESRLRPAAGDAGAMDRHLLLTGSEALSLGAVAAGIRFYSAYPMSPATSILNFLTARQERLGLVVEQAEDEIAAVNMALGAAYAGVKAMTGTSGGGFSLMVEALGFAGSAEIPVVMVDVQRPGPATGLPTRTEQADLKFVVSASQGEFPRAVIALRHHADAFYQTARAFDLAERYRIPVIILSDQYLADASATVPLFDQSRIARPPERSLPANGQAGDYLTYRYGDTGVSPLSVPGKSPALVRIDSDEHDQRGWITESAEVRRRMVDKRQAKMGGLAGEMEEPEFFGADGCETLFFAFGSTYGPLKEAVRLLNAEEAGRYGALCFGDLHPLPCMEAIRRAVRAKRIINVEQNATGQLAYLLRAETGIVCTDSVLKYDGRQLSGGEIAARIRKGEKA